MATKPPVGYSPLKQALSKMPKLKTTKKTKKLMDSNSFNLKQYLGPRTTASSAAEGRLKVAAKSKYKSKLKSLISAVKSKKKKEKPSPYLNTGS